MNRLICASFLAILLNSCVQQGAKAIIEYNISGERLDILDNAVNMYGNIFLNESDSCILKSEMIGDDIVKKLFYSTGSVENIIKKGRGPNEYINLKIWGIDAIGEFYASPDARGQIIKFTADGKPFQSIDLNVRSLNIINLGDNYVSYGDYLTSDNAMYTLYDNVGNKIESFGEYPDDGIATDYKYKTMAYQGKLLSNKTLSRFAFLTIFGNVFDIYEIQNKRIPKKISSIRREFPVYKPRRGAFGVIYDKFNFCYVDSYATEKFIYALYSGKRPNDRDADADRKARETNIIYCYDWDGNHVCNFITNIKILNFCVSSDDKFIIALYSDNGEMKVCTFDIAKVNYK